MAFQHLIFDVADEIATITLNRPEARNALSEPMRTELDTVLVELKREAGRSVKAVILTGAGRAFCAGGDVKAMQSRQKGAEAGRRRMREGHNRFYDLLNLELPVIAAVNGAAAGAGCNLALACDFILATPRSIFMQAFGRIGLATSSWPRRARSSCARLVGFLPAAADRRAAKGEGADLQRPQTLRRRGQGIRHCL